MGPGEISFSCGSFRASLESMSCIFRLTVVLAMLVAPGYSSTTDSLRAHVDGANDLNRTKPAADRASALVEEGVAALQRGDQITAKKLLRSALVIDPTNFTAHTYLGIIADHAGELREAERQFAGAATAAPSSAEAHNNHGAILLKLGRKKEAADEFEASLRLNPNRASALVNLAQIHFAAGTPQSLRKAQTLFDRARVLAPDPEIARSLIIVALRLQEPQQAEKEFPEYTELLSRAPEPVRSPKARAELGSALLEAGLTKQAAVELDAAVKGDPSDVNNIVLLARAYQQQKDLPGAGRTLESAIARGIQAAPIYAALADVYQATGHVENAIPAMHRATQLDTKSEAYRFRYAMLLTDNLAPQAAVIRLQEALAEFPNSPRLWFALGLAQFQDNKNDAATQAFSHALALDSKMSPAFAYLGMIDVDLGKIPEAIEHYWKALAIDERSAVNHYLIAEAWTKLTPPKNGPAEEHLRRALVIDPRFQQARLALGKLYLRAERLTDAVAELEAVVKADPKLAEAYYQLGRAYGRLKRKEEAQAAMAKFEQLSSSEKQQSENQRRDIVRRLADVRF
jgi:Tfp pilus assembly protein PilF